MGSFGQFNGFTISTRCSRGYILYRSLRGRICVFAQSSVVGASFPQTHAQLHYQNGFHQYRQSALCKPLQRWAQSAGEKNQNPTDRYNRCWLLEQFLSFSDNVHRCSTLLPHHKNSAGACCISLSKRDSCGAKR